MAHRLANDLVWSDQDHYSASFADKSIAVSVPRQAGQDWLNPTQVGMETKLSLDNGNELRLLVEKDFACLTERVDEDESDNFPNPNVNC